MADKYIAHKDCGIHATYERNPCPHCERERLSCEGKTMRVALKEIVRISGESGAHVTEMIAKAALISEELNPDG